MLLRLLLEGQRFAASGALEGGLGSLRHGLGLCLCRGIPSCAALSLEVGAGPRRTGLLHPCPTLI